MKMLNSLEKDLKCIMAFSPVVVNDTIYLNLLASANSKEQLIALDRFINEKYGVNLKIIENLN